MTAANANLKRALSRIQANTTTNKEETSTDNLTASTSNNESTSSRKTSQSNTSNVDNITNTNEKSIISKKKTKMNGSESIALPIVRVVRGDFEKISQSALLGAHASAERDWLVLTNLPYGIRYVFFIKKTFLYVLCVVFAFGKNMFVCVVRGGIEKVSFYSVGC